jgi:GTPase-associated protein 1, N-terminal domain type 2/GTPase-associated protein 1, C-terminal domain/GTPase-associated protein 1, middle domain
MAVLQLYYTSCERGLSGYAGFQFNAVTAGVDARLMRQVEQLTGYERPRDVEPGAEPVDLCHRFDDATGVAVTAQVVYAGLDPSGRPGNYFAHALATTDPGHDLDGLRPVELWGSPVWDTRPVDGTELPPLDGPPTGGPIDRFTVSDHLDAVPGATELLARLLTAAVEAGAGGRPVVLRGATSEHNALWIAAVTYLLDDDAARRVSFATYTRRADRCRASLIGTVPDPESDAATAALGGGYVVFDLVDGRHSAVEPHPAAHLLAAAGPLRAPAVWEQAHRFAPAAERSLDAWHPVLAAVHLLDGLEPALPPADLEVVASWLAETVRGPAPLPSARTGAVLRALLERGNELASARLRALVGVARAAEDPGQIDLVEAVLLRRAVEALEAGRPPDADTDPTTERGRKAAARTIAPLLGRRDPGRVLNALEWAKRAGIVLPADVLTRCGRDALGPAVEELAAGGRLAAVCADAPTLAGPLVDGLAENLVKGATKRAVAVLGGPLGSLFGSADLRGHPKLRELLLIDDVAKHRLAPLEALDAIAELRAQNPLSDPAVLRALWPEKRWSVEEAEGLLDRLDTPAGAAARYLEGALTAPTDDPALDPWLRLVSRVRAHGVFAELPTDLQDRLKPLDTVAELLRRAPEDARRDPARWHVEVEEAVRRTGPTVRPVLKGRLARLILSAPFPAEALKSCDEPVFAACVDRAQRRLTGPKPPHDLAAKLIVATLAVGPGPRYRRLCADLLAPTVGRWKRHDLARVRSALRRVPGPPASRKPTAWWRPSRRRHPGVAEATELLADLVEAGRDRGGR